MSKLKSKRVLILLSLICISIVFLCFSGLKSINNKRLIEKDKKDRNVNSINYMSKDIIYHYNGDIEYSIYTNQLIDTYLIAGALYLDFNSQTLLPNTGEHRLYLSAKEYFSPYKDHVLIKKFQKYIYNDDIQGDAIGILLSNYSENKPLDKSIKQYMNGVFKSKEDIDEFLALLTSFYNDSKADEFFKQNLDIYNKMVEYIKDNINKIGVENIIRETEKYVGNKDKYYKNDKVSYQTVITVFRPFMASFFNIASEGKTTLISFQSPNDFSRDPEKFDMSQTISTSIHEFLHSYINAPVENNNSKILEICVSKNKEDYASPMYKCMPWNRIVDENFVRAVQGRIYKKIFNEETAHSEILDKEIEFGGFKKLMQIYNELEEYENKRSIYSTFDDFTPKLIERLFS